MSAYKGYSALTGTNTRLSIRISNSKPYDFDQSEPRLLAVLSVSEIGYDQSNLGIRGRVHSHGA
jgi:hypothetical protein